MGTDVVSRPVVQETHLDALEREAKGYEAKAKAAGLAKDDSKGLFENRAKQARDEIGRVKKEGVTPMPSEKDLAAPVVPAPAAPLPTLDPTVTKPKGKLAKEPEIAQTTEKPEE